LQNLRGITEGRDAQPVRGHDCSRPDGSCGLHALVFTATPSAALRLVVNLAAFGRREDARRAMRRSTVRQMRVDRVDAAMAIRPYMVLALKREFLSSRFDQQLPTQLFSLDFVDDQFGEEGYGPSRLWS